MLNPEKTSGPGGGGAGSLGLGGSVGSLWALTELTIAPKNAAAKGRTISNSALSSLVPFALAAALSDACKRTTSGLSSSREAAGI